MDWCDDNGAGYIFGLAGNAVLDAAVAAAAHHLRFWHALSEAPKARCYKAFDYQAGSWSRSRRVVARIEASMHPDPQPGNAEAMRQEIDVRYVVTSLEGSPERLYEGVYCQRGQAENLITLQSWRSHASSMRRSSRRIVPRAIRRWPIRCGSRCIRRRSG